MDNQIRRMIVKSHDENQTDLHDSGRLVGVVGVAVTFEPELKGEKEPAIVREEAFRKREGEGPRGRAQLESGCTVRSGDQNILVYRHLGAGHHFVDLPFSSWFFQQTMPAVGLSLCPVLARRSEEQISGGLFL